MDAIRPHKTRIRARGFSLIELLVTIAVVATISSMMFPAFGKVRQAALGLMCQNNMRSIAMGIEHFRNANNDRYPESVYAPRDPSRGKPLRPQQLMALTGDERGASGNLKWDGLGVLFGRSPSGAGRYVSDARVFYCPAHGSVHTHERYEPAFSGSSVSTTANSKDAVYGNYHYWAAWNSAASARQSGGKASDMIPMVQNVVLTDGMRTRQDFSHRFGCNALNSDGSVMWIGGNQLDRAVQALPSNDIEVPPSEQQKIFARIVSAIEPSR